MLHIAIGPSPLSLGLLIPCTRAAGFDVCVIGKTGDRSELRYSITPSTGRQYFRDVQWFEGPVSAPELPTDLREIIGRDVPVLITGSLRHAIDERAPLITEIILMRPLDAETILLSCENAHYDAYDDLGAQLRERGGLYLETVVNRMCLERKPATGGHRRVSIHPLGEWLIERPPSYSELLETLSREAPEVEIVDDIEARKDRKLWMVNGAHQALALMARRARVIDLLFTDEDDEAADDLRAAALSPIVQARLGHLHGAMNQALAVRHPTLEDSLEYAIRHVVAYCEHPDSVSRVLGAYKRADLAPFFQALNERLGEPARICASAGLSTDEFRYFIDLLQELLTDRYKFHEGKDISRADLDRDRDAHAVHAFRDLLTGWVPEPEVEQRVGFVEDVLRELREALTT